MLRARILPDGRLLAQVEPSITPVSFFFFWGLRKKAVV